MAKMYRFTSVNNGKSLGYASNPKLVFSIRPLQGDQTPSGYLSKVKVSVIQENYASNVPAAFMLYACTNDTFEDADVITAQAVPNGGGTGWLSLKRSIKSYTEEPDRSDGPVYIFARSLDPGMVTNVECHLVAEAWGRYVLCGAH